jgi:predicted outer membrane protein
MVTDHQRTSSELKGLVNGGKVKATLPKALDSEHQKLLNELKAKSGKEFDQTYRLISGFRAVVSASRDRAAEVTFQREQTRA